MQNWFSWIKILLYPFALVYGAIVWIRNRLYDSGFYSSVEFDTPVISVGNLNVGGTGKTPHVEYLVRLLQYQFQLATLSRGYRRRTQGFLIAEKDTNALKIGDEPMQYFRKFPDLVVSVGEDRMMAIPSILQRHPEVEVIIMDDAFQHRSVKPGYNILITDYHSPFYEDYILPYGRLRESRKAYQRADAIIMSKCPVDLSAEEAQKIEQKIAALPHQKVFFSSIKYGDAYDFFNQEKINFKGKNIIVVCGIANPEPLMNHINPIAGQTHLIKYPDHHYFITSDLEEIKTAVNNWNVENKIILTTEKDASRLALFQNNLKDYFTIPIAVLPIEIEILLNKKHEFDTLVEQFVGDKIDANRTVFPDDITFEEIL